MAREIERRFLVPNGGWPEDAEALPIRQGYFVGVEGASIRIRRTGAGDCITIKGPALRGSRLEFEYVIPPDDAEEMLGLCARPPLEKMRHAVAHRGQRWVVDVFERQAHRAGHRRGRTGRYRAAARPATVAWNRDHRRSRI